jgi:hypothetical protein
MHDPLRRRDFPHGAQQSVDWPAWGIFGSRTAAAILGVTLLCAASAVREFDITIHERRVEGSTSTIRVKRGETVVLHWRTDEAVSLHVHGYDLQAQLTLQRWVVQAVVMSGLKGRESCEAGK